MKGNAVFYRAMGGKPRQNLDIFSPRGPSLSLLLGFQKYGSVALQIPASTSPRRYHGRAAFEYTTRRVVFFSLLWELRVQDRDKTSSGAVFERIPGRPARQPATEPGTTGCTAFHGIKSTLIHNATSFVHIFYWIRTYFALLLLWWTIYEPILNRIWHGFLSVHHSGTCYTPW